MTRRLCTFILISLFLVQLGCEKTEREKEIEFISISFAMGESSLRILKNGQAILYYGSLPQGESIKTGAFDAEQLYKQVKNLLHPNAPREDWPNPNAKAGMVLVKFKGDTKTTSYLIFDAEDFTKRLFEKARKNIVGEIPE